MSVCVRCGTEFSESETVCPVCGTLRPGRLPVTSIDARSAAASLEVTDQGSEKAPSSAAASWEPWSQKKERVYSRLGGWLFYIVLSLSLLSLLRIFLAVLGLKIIFAEGKGISFYLMSASVASVVISLLHLVVVYLIIRRKALFMPVLMVASALSLTYSVINQIVATIGNHTTSPTQPLVVIALTVFILLFGFLLGSLRPIILMMYFYYSERVHVYMGSDSYITKYPWVKTCLDKMASFIKYQKPRPPSTPSKDGSKPKYRDFDADWKAWKSWED